MSLRPFQILAAVACAAWIAAVLATFRAETWIWAAAFGLFAVCAGIAVGAFVFLRRRGARLGALLLSAVVWIAVGLLISNAIAGRRLERQRFWGGFVPDPLTGWYPEPNLEEHQLAVDDGTFLVSTDEFGHRNRLPYPADRVLPVIVQGDSNVFGFGLDDHQTVGARLNALDPAGRYYNVGISGFDVHQFYFQYQRLARAFDIGARVILFNARNDFTMSALSSTYQLRRPYLAVSGDRVIEVTDNVSPIPAQGYGRFFIDKFSGYDPLIADTANAWAEIYPEPLLRIPLARQLIRTFHRKLVGVAARLSRSERVELAAPAWLLLPPSEWPEPFRSFASDFEEILGRLAEQEPDTVLFLFPFREQVIEAERTALAARLPEEVRPRADPRAFGRWLAEASDRAGIELVDLTPDFLAAEQPGGLFQYDGHLTAAGIELCAQRIADWR